MLGYFLEMHKLIAFGDIHGCYMAAERAIDLAEELGAIAIFLGDYVDRGPSAIRTLNALLAAKENHHDWVFLRGNHDQMLLDLLTGSANPTDQGTVLGMNYSYSQASRSFDEWRSISAKEQGAIESFLNSTDFFYESHSHIFCHAVLRDTGQHLEEKSEEELMWNYQSTPLWTGKPFVHGHDLVVEPEFGQWGININTRCGYGGCLTGLHIDVGGNPVAFYTIQENGGGLNVKTLF